MNTKLIFYIIVPIYGSVPLNKDYLFSDFVFRDFVNRMSQNLPDENYMDLDGRLPLDARSLGHDLEDEQLYSIDYDGMADENLNPSIRDQEYLEHSSLWGNQYVSGGAGEGKQHLRPKGTVKNTQEVKTDASLPAYCNPPNPCPVGYSEQQGCIEEFENTALYSRRYQASQDCMCDSEHMFDCPNPSDSMVDDAVDNFNDLEFNRFLQHTMKINSAMQHKNLIAKKYHLDNKNYKSNPFLTGERLPVAAKKGNKVLS